MPQWVKLVKFITPVIHAEPLHKWVFIVRVLSDRTLISAFKKIIVWETLGRDWKWCVRVATLNRTGSIRGDLHAKSLAKAKIYGGTVYSTRMAR